MAGAIAAMLLVLDLSAQTRPDFSGRWTSDPDPAAAAAAPAAPSGTAPQRGAGPAGRGRSGDMGSGWGSTLTITQNATRLTVEYMFFSRGDMQPPLKFVYALDGSETKNSVMMGHGIQVQPSKTKWDGDKLVIVTTHTFINPETNKPQTIDVTQTLSLESPASLVVETTRSAVLGGPATATKTVYRKL